MRWAFVEFCGIVRTMEFKAGFVLGGVLYLIWEFA